MISILVTLSAIYFKTQSLGIDSELDVWINNDLPSGDRELPSQVPQLGIHAAGWFVSQLVS